MIYGQELSISNTHRGVEDYSEKLKQLFIDDIIQMADLPQFTRKANEKALNIYEKIVIHRNDSSILTDNELVGTNILGIDIGNKVAYLIKQYTRCIMKTLGKIAECVIMDRCRRIPDCNMIYINIATFKKDIYKKYDDIDYEQHIPFSPSHKYFLYKENGLLQLKPVPDRNTNHETKDIGWCTKDNYITQLRASIPDAGYIGNAKLQVKTTLHPSKIRLDKYFVTPVIIFNISEDDDGMVDLKRKYPNHVFHDVKDIDPEASIEMSYYFKILASYITGITSSFDINEKMLEDERLAYLFRAPIRHILSDKLFDASGLIQLIEQNNKPIEIYA